MLAIAIELQSSEQERYILKYEAIDTPMKE
jgi:hypothetical protein